MNGHDLKTCFSNHCLMAGVIEHSGHYLRCTSFRSWSSLSSYMYVRQFISVLPMCNRLSPKRTKRDSSVKWTNCTCPYWLMSKLKNVHFSFVVFADQICADNKMKRFIIVFLSYRPPRLK